MGKITLVARPLLLFMKLRYKMSLCKCYHICLRCYINFFPLSAGMVTNFQKNGFFEGMSISPHELGTHWGFKGGFTGFLVVFCGFSVYFLGIRKEANSPG